jgi:hypothetical protein
MIEMRWYVPVVGNMILQYRQQYDSAVRAGMGWDANSLAQTAKMQWSPWKDVPLESEKDPNCP